MTETLPLVIRSSTELIGQFPRIAPVVNRLEAQFNFQTLTAAWYGDEDNVLSICLRLETPSGFARQIEPPHSGQRMDFADDVVCFQDKAANIIDCYIAITDSELALLIQNNKLLMGYIQVKLQKVLNLIAAEQGLTPI